jgi:Uncharacterized conserved protein
MLSFKADLHLHSVLSPCGDLEMSPTAMISTAKQRGLQVMAMTDHNCTQQAPLVKELGAREDIFVLMGAEITSKEEAHCLAFVPDETARQKLQTWLDAKLPKIELDEDKFGYQLIVNEKEEIIGQKEYLLISAIDATLDEIYSFVHSIGGLFVPAHVDKPAFSLTSQLGFVPPDIKADALEISSRVTKENFIKKNAYLKKFQFLQDSDAHYIPDIAKTYCLLNMQERTFEEFALAVRGQEGRGVEVVL